MSDLNQRAINLSLALIAKFDAMTHAQKFGFAASLMHCACPCCAVLKEIMSSNIFTEVFNKGNS